MKPKNICIIGLGYVGLTLSVILAERGFKVFGIEIKTEILKKIKQGHAHFYEKGLDSLIQKHINQNLIVARDIPKTEKMDAFVISVGTPLNPKNKKPRLEFIINAARQVTPHLHDHSLVILRSTVPVGTTRNVVYPILKKANPNVLIAFCPERTVEGKALTELRSLAQIIGGLNEESTEKAMDIFRKVTYTTIEVSSLEAAEMIKLIDNSFRDLNFAYANEIGLICKNANLNAIEVIRAANQGYHRNNIAVPGYVAGPCLIKDPHILVDFSKKNGYYPRLIKAARDLNEYLPQHVADRVQQSLNQRKKKINQAKIFISGFAFKGIPETDDIRDSSTLILLDNLKNLGSKNIFGHDFIVPQSILKNLKIKTCSIAEGFKNADCVVIMNNHPNYENLKIEQLAESMASGGLLFDSWHLFQPESIKNIQYEGLGLTL